MRLTDVSALLAAFQDDNALESSLLETRLAYGIMKHSKDSRQQNFDISLLPKGFGISTASSMKAQ